MRKSLFFTVLFSTNVFALDLPDIKPGLWENTTKDERGADSSKFCMGDKTNLKDIADQSKKMTQGMCGEGQIEKVGKTYVTKNECNFGVSKISIESVASGNFSSEYTVKTKSSIDHVSLGKKTSTSTSTSKYLGACPSDMRVGDMILSDGRKVNVNDMMKEAVERSKKIDPKKIEEMKRRLEKLKQTRENIK